MMIPSLVVMGAFVGAFALPIYMARYMAKQRAKEKRNLERSLKVHQATHLRRLKEWREKGFLNEKEHDDMTHWLLDKYDRVLSEGGQWEESSWKWEIPSSVVLPSGHAFILVQSFKSKEEEGLSTKQPVPSYLKYLERGFTIPSFEALGEIVAARAEIQTLFTAQTSLLSLRIRQETKARTNEEWLEEEQRELETLREEKKANILRLNPVAIAMGWRKVENKEVGVVETAYVEWRQVGDMDWRLLNRHLHAPYEEALRIYQKVDATAEVRIEAKDLLDEILTEWQTELRRREDARQAKDAEDLAFARRMAGIQKGESL